MEFNGEIGLEHLQWLIASIVTIIFTVSLYLRKHSSLNSAIKHALLAFSLYSIASFLFSAPLIFLSNSTALLILNIVGNTALYGAFLVSSFMLQDLSTARYDGISKLFIAMYRTLWLPVFIYTTYLYIQMGVISENGEFFFPTDSVHAIGESIMNLSPLIISALYIFYGLTTKSSLATKLTFIIMGLFTFTLALFGIVELLFTGTIAEMEGPISLIRTVLIFIFLLSVLSITVIQIRSFLSKKSH